MRQLIRTPAELEISNEKHQSSRVSSLVITWRNRATAINFVNERQLSTNERTVGGAKAHRMTETKAKGQLITV